MTVINKVINRTEHAACASIRHRANALLIYDVREAILSFHATPSSNRTCGGSRSHYSEGEKELRRGGEVDTTQLAKGRDNKTYQSTHTFYRSIFS